jgi:hypothetical protein
MNHYSLHARLGNPETACFAKGFNRRRKITGNGLATPCPWCDAPAMKLQQGQIWEKAGQRLRIVHIERLSVEYMRLYRKPPVNGKRIPHHTVTKKEFCRMIKDATLIPENPVSTPSE